MFIVYLGFLIVFSLPENRDSGELHENANEVPFTHAYCGLQLSKNPIFIQVGGPVEFFVTIFFTSLFAYPLYKFLYGATNNANENQPNLRYTSFNFAPSPLSPFQKQK